MIGVAFRNVEGTSETPVDRWPYEAIVATLERGLVQDWLALLREIRRSPWGVVARQIEEYLGYEQPYGVGPLFARAIAEARRERAQAERDEVATRVRTLVEESGLSRDEFARRIGTSRPRLSTYCTGKVTPSAALLLRMERVTDRG